MVPLALLIASQNIHLMCPVPVVTHAQQLSATAWILLYRGSGVISAVVQSMRISTLKESSSLALDTLGGCSMRETQEHQRAL